MPRRKRIRSKTVVQRQVRIKATSNSVVPPDQRPKRRPPATYDSNVYRLRKWGGVLKGHPCFIIGNAPSALGHDYSILSDFFTLGINRAYDLIDPTVLMWQDVEFWRDHHENIIGLEAIRVAKYSANPKRIALSFSMSGNDPQYVKKCDRLHGYGNTGFLAVELAVCMGFSELVLLGMDCLTDQNGDTDFYGVNPYHRPHTLSNCRRGLHWVKKTCPVVVSSCSDSDLWPKQPLADVVESLSEWKRGRAWYKQSLKEAGDLRGK